MAIQRFVLELTITCTRTGNHNNILLLFKLIVHLASRLYSAIMLIMLHLAHPFNYFNSPQVYLFERFTKYQRWLMKDFKQILIMKLSK